MTQSGITASHPQAHLPDGLQKRQGFNVTYRTANLDNSHIGLPVISSLGTTGDEVLYFIGDVGDDLYGFPQIIAPPLLAQHRLIDLAGSKVVDLAHPG